MKDKDLATIKICKFGHQVASLVTVWPGVSSIAPVPSLATRWYPCWFPRGPLSFWIFKDPQESLARTGRSSLGNREVIDLSVSLAGTEIAMLFLLLLIFSKKNILWEIIEFYFFNLKQSSHGVISLLLPTIYCSP